MSGLRRFIRENSLSLAFFVLLLGTLIGQSIAGIFDFNAQQLASGGQQISYLRFITSSSFAVDVAENWQSEYLQFSLYIIATTWLIQRGSSESKKMDEVGTQSDEEQKVGKHASPKSPKWAKVGGWRTTLYGRSLGAVMTFFFFGSMLAQAVAGRAAYNHEQLTEYENPVSFWGYVTSSNFWNRALQNWQSEFLAVCSMAVFAIYFRQRGSPESKLVGAPHDATAQDA